MARTNLASAAGKVERMIVYLRGQGVILDNDLARLYEVPTKALVQAVNRNRSRFPPDFMFQLTIAKAIESKRGDRCGRFWVDLEAKVVTMAVGDSADNLYEKVRF